MVAWFQPKYVVIAEVLSQQLGIPLLQHCLVRTRYTRRQVGQDARARWKNMADRFTVRAARRIQGCRILLVDDVLTTGATTWHGAQVLLDQGAAAVHVIALAAPHKGAVPSDKASDKATV